MTATSTATDRSAVVARRATLGTVGAALWTLSSGAWAAADLEYQPFGTLAFVAVAASWWLFMVLPPVLLIAGHAALRGALGPGRLPAVGIPIAATGLTGMAVGMGIEVASMTAGGGEVALGHAVLLIGFLVSMVGAVLVGIAVLRRRRDALSRAGGWLLVAAFPLGVGIGLVGDLVLPQNDAVFWAALTVPTGLAWLLLGRSLTLQHRDGTALR